MSIASYSSDESRLLGASANVSVPQTTVYRTFVHETVILNLETGGYHGVNTTGGAMLDCLARTGRIDLAAVELADTFDVPVAEIEQDLCQFCMELAVRGLLVVDHS